MNRRQAMERGLMAAALGLPTLQKLKAAALPDETLFRQNQEKYWRRIRDEQFLLPEERVFLNNGTLGITPRPVINAMVDYVNRSAGLLMPNHEYPRWGYETLDAERAEFAEYLGCKKEELAFLHNATEALSTIAAGIDLKPGDEVVMTDQEHPSGRSPWYQKAERYGIKVREVKIPFPPKDSGQLADVMTSAIGPSTRVLFFSGMLSQSGVIMPVREICDFARSKGVITAVDGAHMNGQMALNIGEMHCDYFAGSPHKWLFAPAGCGLLYARDEVQDNLWANTVTGAWNNKKELRAARFQMVGTNNRAIFEGMMAGLRFHKEIGPQRIFERIHQLARSVYARVAEIPYLEPLSSQDHRLYACLVAFRINKPDLKKLWAEARKRRIWCTEGPVMRLSSHIHTRPSDIDLFFRTMREVLG
ncbi:MAG: aminotransferase class V-fold PLP-dependent enzyme [Acidobacteria bacterium]|nr:aminotransferase class V-fold PLP-dependent enzyme [Acidobacteriota bacterium]